MLSPTAAPAAASRAVSSTAVPVAVSQPKNAEPTLMPPYASFSRATTVWRSAVPGSTRVSCSSRAAVPPCASVPSPAEDGS